MRAPTLLLLGLGIAAAQELVPCVAPSLPPPSLPPGDYPARPPRPPKDPRTDRPGPPPELEQNDDYMILTSLPTNLAGLLGMIGLYVVLHLFFSEINLLNPVGERHLLLW